MDDPRRTSRRREAVAAQHLGESVFDEISCARPSVAIHFARSVASPAGTPRSLRWWW